MTDKEKKSKIADILMDFQEEYSNEVINRPMLASLYAGNILSFIDSLQEEPVSMWHDASEEPKPNMELICVGQYGNPLVLSSNSDSFKERYISKWAYFNDLLNLSNAQRTTKDCKEPVSEELEEASKEWLRPQLDKSYANYGEVKMMELTHFDGYAMLDAIEFGAKWQKEKEYTCYEEAFEDGAKWKNENLWKPADGDDLPEIDREVIAILDYDFGHYKVVYAHRPNPDGWNGTNIDTGEKEHFEPEIYDKGGWNAPNIVYWLDAKLPYEENKIIK